MAEWLQETESTTIFEGDIFRKGEPRTGPNSVKAWALSMTSLAVAGISIVGRTYG